MSLHDIAVIRSPLVPNVPGCVDHVIINCPPKLPALHHYKNEAHFDRHLILRSMLSCAWMGFVQRLSPTGLTP